MSLISMILTKSKLLPRLALTLWIRQYFQLLPWPKFNWISKETLKYLMNKIFGCHILNKEKKKVFPEWIFIIKWERPFRDKNKNGFKALLLSWSLKVLIKFHLSSYNLLLRILMYNQFELCSFTYFIR